MLPIVDADTFYAQRDSRMAVAGQMPSAAVTVAVVLPPAVGTGDSALELLEWTSSLLRRLGRAFSRSIIISNVSESTRAQIAQELLGADPFGPVEWRPYAPESFTDLAVAIWLGAFESIAPSTVANLSVAVHGWTCRITTEPGEGEPPHVDAASPALAVAASQSVGEIFRRYAGLPSPSAVTTLWTATDTGGVTTDAGIGSGWLARGGAKGVPVPWSRIDGASTPTLKQLLLVGAGALGWNAARILVKAPVVVSECVVVDHDPLDISNLNRLVGSSFANTGKYKSDLVSDHLAKHGIAARAVSKRYEHWIANGEPFDFVSRDSAVLVGVDQAMTRLHVAAQWPHILVNGATSGLQWMASIHRPGMGACLGCYYGSGRQPFDELRRGVPCGAAAAGVVPGTTRVLAASFPFVSFAAAAHMVAILVHECAIDARNPGSSGVFREQNVLAGEAGRVVARERDSACRLLCGNEAVRLVLESR